MRPNDLNDTDWLAFRYVAGELSSQQVAEFESRLESDETAQQALSQVVEISLAISAARAAESESMPVFAANSAKQSARPVLWLSACLAASAAVLLTCWIADRDTGSTTRVAPDYISGEDPVQLAIIWNETRSVLPSRDEWSTDDPSDAQEIAMSAPDFRDEPEAWGDAETPPWVWAAVTAAEEAPLSGESEPGGI